MLRAPGVRNDARGGSLLPQPKRAAEEGMVAIMPRRFDQHASQMGIPRLGDAAADT
jgi:hypothetical protein